MEGIGYFPVVEVAEVLLLNFVHVCGHAPWMHRACGSSMNKGLYQAL